MCGIVGFINPEISNQSALLDQMEQVILPRGPDGSGRFLHQHLAMGMRRLAVIDLAHGQQPLKSANDQVIAFQNGEIYNHRLLRRELEQSGARFATESDTEVLAHGYAAWGLEGLLKRLDGMYAIAILDLRTRTLHLARDRFGEKPLYVAQDGLRFAYASDLRAITLLPWVQPEIDQVSLARYLALHYVPGDRSIYKGIRKLLPGHVMSLSIDRPSIEPHPYYQIPVSRATESRLSDDALAALIEESVCSRLIADVPVGVFLSGGLDSSIVAATAARHVEHLSTFSIGFPSAQHDESPFAKAMANAIGARHHEFIFDDQAFATLLPKVAGSLDEPLGDQASLPLYWLCHEARQHVTVALSGEGADEVFAGYGYYSPFAPADTGFSGRLAQWFHRVKKNAGSAGSIGSMRGTPSDPFADHSHTAHRSIWEEGSLTTQSGFPLLTSEAERLGLTRQSGLIHDEWEQGVTRWLAQANDPLQRAGMADLATWLSEDLLTKFDRMAMANSLEGRAPFLAPKLVEAGLTRLTPHQRMTSRQSKVALRRIANRWLPPEILNRRKQGFVLPMRQWLTGWFERQGGVAAWIERTGSGLMDRSELERLVSLDLAQGVGRERLLFALVMLQEWHFCQGSRPKHQS